MIGIYKITNLVNKKVYIGQSSQIKKRWYQHIYDSYNKNCCNNNYETYLHKAIRKYGKENFLFEIIEECQIEELNEKEQYWIKYYKSEQNGYNQTLGGDGKLKLDRKLIYKYWDEGKNIVEIQKLTGYSRSGICQILINYSNYSKEEANKRRAQSRQKKVNQYDLNGNFIKQYNSIKEAATQLKISADTISATCRKKQKTSGGYRWSFA